MHISSYIHAEQEQVATHQSEIDQDTVKSADAARSSEE